MIKKILVPLDGSALAEAAIPYAEQIATRTSAEALLFCAVPPVAVWDAASSMIKWDREEALAREYIDGQRARLAEAGVTARGEVTMGSAAEAIMKVAEVARVDLIVMSTHGRSGISRWVFGSVARRVLESSSLPILMIRAQKEVQPAPSITRILVPLDASPLAQGVLPFVEDLARAFKAPLVLFNAIVPVASYPGFETVLPATAGDLIEELQQQANTYLSGVAAEIKGRGLEVTALTAIDLAADGILAAAKQSGADLIAIGTHGRSGLGRALLGSVADAVIRRADVPCLVIHPPKT